MLVALMFLAILALACIASAGLIFSTEDVSVAETVTDNLAPPGTTAS